MERFIRVTDENVADAGKVHSSSWQQSHRSFCSPEFVARHTPERQARFLLHEMEAGKQVYLLEADGEPVGVVSLCGNLIENLYIAPDKQNQGYGTKLLHFAIARCDGTPTLWILDNNDGARRLYERNGFKLTGTSKRLTDALCEMEMAHTP